MKKFILLISFIIMIFLNSISNANYNLGNDRFAFDEKEINNFIESKDYISAKSKIFENIDKTNLLYCNYYDYLIKLDYSNDEKSVINEMSKICSNFVNGNFIKSFDGLKKNGSDKLGKDSDIYLLYKMLEFSIYKITVTVDGYEKLYNLEEVNKFLSDNKDRLLSLFPISYNFRLTMGYFDLKDKAEFNKYYSYLEGKDYYLFPFLYINKVIINGENRENLKNVFDYENVILKDNNGSYNANSYFFVSKILYEFYSSKNDKLNEVNYFLFMQKELNLLKDYQTFNYLFNLENVEKYKNIIISYVGDDYYLFLYHFGILKSFIDSGTRVSPEEYSNLMNSYEFILNYYENNKLDIENGRVDISFKESYIDFGLIELINLTETQKLEVTSNIGIFLENNKTTYPIFVVERFEDKFLLSINNNVVSDSVGDKNRFINIALILLFIFILIGGIIFLTQKK